MKDEFLKPTMLMGDCNGKMGLMAPILRDGRECVHCAFSLSMATHADEQGGEVTLAIFVAFLTECLVDLWSSFMERSQGIKIEAWCHHIANTEVRWREMISRVLTIARCHSTHTTTTTLPPL